MKLKLNYLLFYISIFLSVAPSVFAQRGASKFGKVSKEELEMTVYDKDTSASAVVLFSKGSSEIKYFTEKGFVLVYKNHTRIKILKKEGLEYADVEIPLYVDRTNVDEAVFGLKAQAYNLENGKIVISKLNKKDVFEEDASKHTKLKKFAIPNVKVGSVIEYKYSISSDFFYIKKWYFQTSIPVIWSEYSVSIPEYFKFKHFTTTYIRPTSKELNSTMGNFVNGQSYQITTTTYIYKDVPAFKKEDYMTTPDDYLAKIEFEHLLTRIPGRGIETYTSTWTQIYNRLMARDDFGGALNRSGIVKDLSQVVAQVSDPEEKIELAYELLRKKMRWNGEYGMLAETSLRSAYSKSEGNVADINLLLVNLLRSVDLDAYPVLLSTRSHGRINKVYPKRSSFNYVVAFVRVGNKHMLLDASDDYIAPGELPYQCMNGEGLLVLNSAPFWLPLRTKEKFSKNISVMMNFNDDRVTADMRIRSHSMTARDLRYKILKEGKDKYIEDYINKQEEWEIENYSIENEQDVKKPVLEKVKISNFNNVDADADLIYLPAIIIDDEISNPFTDEERKYPVDFAVPIAIKYILNFIVPEGFVVEETPENSTVVLPEKAAVFVYKSYANNNILQINCQIWINRTLFSSDEYKLLREFYTHVTEKLNEQIVLKRI